VLKELFLPGQRSFLQLRDRPDQVEILRLARQGFNAQISGRFAIPHEQLRCLLEKVEGSIGVRVIGKMHLCPANQNVDEHVLADRELQPQNQTAAKERAGEHTLLVRSDDHEGELVADLDRSFTAEGFELGVTQGLKQAIRNVAVGLVNLIDQHHAAVARISAFFDDWFRRPALLSLRLRIRPVEAPPQRPRTNESANLEKVPQLLGYCTMDVGRLTGLGQWIFRVEGKSTERAGDLGFGEPLDGVELPEQVTRLRVRLDYLRDEWALQAIGRGRGELGLPHTGLTHHQERPARRERRPDCQDALGLELVALLWS